MGIAASLGYEDGFTPADEMFAAVKRIVRAVSVPVSADLESGYGLSPTELVERVLDTGAVGCNLEDSEHHTTLRDPERQAEWLAEVRAAAGPALFINARVDTFLVGAGDPVDAIARARRYVAAGADCVYPILAPARVFHELRANIDGPLNMAARADVESVTTLARLGATRITFGPWMQRHAADATGELAGRLCRRRTT